MAPVFLESKHVNSCMCRLGYLLVWPGTKIPSRLFLSANNYLLITHYVKHCARHCESSPGACSPGAHVRPEREGGNLSGALPGFKKIDAAESQGLEILEQERAACGHWWDVQVTGQMDWEQCLLASGSYSVVLGAQ